MIAITIDYQKSQDWRPKRLYCNFRLSTIVAITWRHFILAHRGRKSPTCRWNFDTICCSSSGITISGFGGHVTVTLLTLSASSPRSKTTGLPSDCSDICHTVGALGTSGFDGYIAISGYPSMSHLFVDTFFEFGVVENFCLGLPRSNYRTYFKFVRLYDSMTTCSR